MVYSRYKTLCCSAKAEGHILIILLIDDIVQAEFYKHHDMRRRPLVTRGGMGHVANASGTSVKYIIIIRTCDRATPNSEFRNL